MKKITAVFMAICILFICGCSQVRLDDYENQVLSDQTEKEDNYLYLKGLSEDLCVLPQNVEFDPDFVEAYGSGLFAEDEKTVLYASNIYKKLYPASLTKCMTALLVLEHFDDLDFTTVAGDEVSYQLSDDASLAHIQVGGTYTIRQLLYALLLPSGNDAANVLAVAVSGSVDEFVTLMNQRADELGLTGTHFQNPHGLFDKEHYSTVYDLYIIFHNCLTYSDFKEIISTRDYDCNYINSDGTIVTQKYTSTNSYTLGNTVPENGVTVLGGKTGYTPSAGRCLILYVKDASGASYISIILGANGYDVLYQQMNHLLTKISD